MVSSKFFEDLPQDLQTLLKRTGAETGAKLVAANRKDNEESLRLLVERGMVLVEGDDDLKSDRIRAMSDQAARTLMDSGYLPEETVNRVQDWLREYRATGAGTDGAH
jgi:TRAP-type C4-dicarboxylate transport system substrate-binding protein